jgi:hypothetical protein
VLANQSHVRIPRSPPVSLWYSGTGTSETNRLVASLTQNATPFIPKRVFCIAKAIVGPIELKRRLPVIILEPWLRIYSIYCRAFAAYRRALWFSPKRTRAHCVSAAIDTDGVILFTSVVTNILCLILFILIHLMSYLFDMTLVRTRASLRSTNSVLLFLGEVAHVLRWCIIINVVRLKCAKQMQLDFMMITVEVKDRCVLSSYLLCSTCIQWTSRDTFPNLICLCRI